MTLSEATIRYGDQAAIDAGLAGAARRLAEVPRPADDSRMIEVLVCRLGAEEYALELRLLHGVHAAVGLTPVPCTAPCVAGLLNLRGELLTVLDLAAVLGLPGSQRREVLIADTQQVRVGLLVGEVVGVRRIGLDGLDRALSGSAFTRGIANAGTVLLDLAALLADGRFELPNQRPQTLGT
ncbi:MAG: chemotaxis protein CheW [Chloroflexota bacterium]|nr:chemotaxis protein CheW [Chloroflexota bacterium]